MNVAYKHFNRTIKLGQIAGIDFEKSINLRKMTHQSELKSLTKKLKICIKLSKNIYLKRIKEIYAIEKEKLDLRDSEKVIESIFKKETSYNIEREKLLSFNFWELQEVTLVINPLLNIYESNWKWCDRDPFQRLFDLKKLLTSKENNYYFLLEKTGTFDALVDSNVSEFPLTKYQYFLLQLFEEPKKVRPILKEFVKVFEIANAKEKKELLVLTEKLIKELIFRRFIVLPDATTI